MNNPYDVEWGYNSISDRNHEINRQIDKKVDDKIDLFLYDVQRMFEKHGVQSFHKYDGYDFDYSLDTLREHLKKDLRDKIACFCEDDE